jgi:hypothetical protein
MEVEQLYQPIALGSILEEPIKCIFRFDLFPRWESKFSWKYGFGIFLYKKLLIYFLARNAGQTAPRLPVSRNQPHAPDEVSKI